MSKVATCSQEKTLLDFIRRFGGPCMSDLSDGVILDYLSMRAADGALCLVKWNGDLVGWLDGKQCFRGDMENHWGGDDPCGDCLVFANFVVHPEFGLEVRRELVRQMKVRWPNWRDLSLWMFREKYGGFVEVSSRYVDLAVKEICHG